MAIQRFRALEEVLSRTPVQVELPKATVSEFYGENVFNKETMKKWLSDEAYKSVLAAMEQGIKIDRSIADDVASSMKAWAMSKGVSHYTHWFQPLTGTTAEKHDAFAQNIEDGKALERFDGDQLVQQEPDASSFPNGGIRSTFEARGYTAWDPTSPAFIIEQTLCIPTIFVSYTGEALDYKTPLLKALHAIDKAAVDVCQYFDKNVTKVTATLGWEQEYFLIDSAFYNARPDIAFTGRALFGHSGAKGQQLEDHYFGSIPERVLAYIRELEIECYRLGIPVKTRHNEVAPNQFECAPVFEEANLAVDHNSLLMDIMEKVARRHNFRVLLHEKPFAGINGSGKHNNWSMSTNTGKNLLGPGKTPKTNLMFLTFFINTIKAVHDNADLMRAVIASAGNEHRLGANEAPPAIVSIFIGTQLTKVMEDIEKKVKSGKMTPEEKTELKLNIGKIPEILLDNTDRNRTSPFAFTGNKFEFRAVGSSANCAAAMTVVNTIMADQLVKFKHEVDAKIKKGVEKDEAIFQVLRDYISGTKNILFEGNGYGEEWVKEAKKRGLSNIKSTPEALKIFTRKEVIKLFKQNNIMTEREQHARYEIQLETYMKKIQIESRMIGEIAMGSIIPSAVKYQTMLIENVRGLQEIAGFAPALKGEYANAKTKKVVLAGADEMENQQLPLERRASNGGLQSLAAPQIETINKISNYIASIQSNVYKMIDARKKANNLEDMQDKASAYCDHVKPYFDEIRYHADKLEFVVDDELWALPKYREMLFTR
ncbi:MAG: glutamine synthetase type III [Bacteroidetes bacterium]|nr:MAG: glutamine synthetase type III [Bacteroidota bacterium]